MQQTIRVFTNDSRQKEVDPVDFQEEVQAKFPNFGSMTLSQAVNALNKQGWIFGHVNDANTIVWMVRQVPETKEDLHKVEHANDHPVGEETASDD